MIVYIVVFFKKIGVHMFFSDMQFQQMRFVVHLCIVGVVLREHM
jgi:hypothetical protein